MAVLSLHQAHKEDLQFLNSQPAQKYVAEMWTEFALHFVSVSNDFCKMASNFLSKGLNLKLYQTASQKLQVDVKQVQSGVEGLAYLFVEAAKNEISEEDFKLTLVDLGFSEESAGVICSEYLSQKNLLESVLPLSGVQHFQYKDLQWRFETQVSSKSIKNQIQPRVVLKLELEKCGEIQNHCLQADIPNIIHMNQLLSQALQESRTQHSKRIQRAVT